MLPKKKSSVLQDLNTLYSTQSPPRQHTTSIIHLSDAPYMPFICRLCAVNILAIPKEKAVQNTNLC